MQHVGMQCSPLAHCKVCKDNVHIGSSEWRGGEARGSVLRAGRAALVIAKSGRKASAESEPRGNSTLCWDSTV